MNQRQIRYLDNRIQEEKNRFWNAITAKYRKLKEKTLTGMVEDFQKGYTGLLMSLSKEGIAKRFLEVFMNACRHYNDYGSFERHGILDLDGSNDVRVKDPLGVFDINGFIPEWNRRAAELEKKLEADQQQEYDRLSTEVCRLRDRINLGDAEEATKSLEEFVSKWTKIIEEAEKEDGPKKESKSKKTGKNSVAWRQ